MTARSATVRPAATVPVAARVGMAPAARAAREGHAEMGRVPALVATGGTARSAVAATAMTAAMNRAGKHPHRCPTLT